MRTLALFISMWIHGIAYLQQPPKAVEALMKFYPQIIRYDNNYLYFRDGSRLPFDDGKIKSEQQRLEAADIEDQFYYCYGSFSDKRNDAGRIRNDQFFKKIYGQTKKEVENNLTEVIWCPKLVHQKMWVSTVNNFDSIFVALSNELDQHPEWRHFLQQPGGSFVWRNIAGTNRLSSHSFGVSIDINVRYSNYWQWDCQCTNENHPLKYSNKIPEALVKIFEKHGFIWGGRWKHYDTMHFEYRPELIYLRKIS